MTTLLTLPTYVIGPRNPEGRDFSFLAETLPVASLAPAAQAIAGALPLALSAWSRHGEPGCVAAVPLGGADAPVLVMRVAMLGFTGIGRLVFAHALLIDAASLAAIGHASYCLLDAIPVPDGSAGFGQNPLTVDTAALPAGRADDWPGLGLAWQDRCIVVDGAADSEAVLRSALASIEPVEQRQRVRGWVSSGGFSRVGGFDPGAAFQAVTMADGSHALPAAMLPYRALRSGFSGEVVDPPASYLRWRDLTGLLGYGGSVAHSSAALPDWLRWRVEDSANAPDSVVERVLHGAAATLGGPDMVHLLALLVESGDLGLADPARTTFWRLVDSQAEDAAAAYYPTALASGHATAIAPMLARGWPAARLSPLDRIGEETLSMLLANGLLPAINAHPSAIDWVKAAPIGHVVRVGAALAQNAADEVGDYDALLAEVVARLSADFATGTASAAPVGPVFAAVFDRTPGRLVRRQWRQKDLVMLIDATARLRPDALPGMFRNWLTLFGPDDLPTKKKLMGPIALWLRLAKAARTASA